jgi:hypothetical protein
MPYLISLCIVVGAVVVLGVLLIRLSTPARRLTGTAHLCGAYLSDRIGLLNARIAGLKVELARRRRPRHAGNPGGPTAA